MVKCKGCGVEMGNVLIARCSEKCWMSQLFDNNLNLNSQSNDKGKEE